MAIRKIAPNWCFPAVQGVRSMGGKAGLSLKTSTMITKTWKTKDIWFKVSDRRAATSIVKRLIKNGWEFQCGAIMENGLVEGDDSIKSRWIDGEPTEELQLYKL